MRRLSRPWVSIAPVFNEAGGGSDQRGGHEFRSRFPQRYSKIVNGPKKGTLSRRRCLEPPRPAGRLPRSSPPRRARPARAPRPRVVTDISRPLQWEPPGTLRATYVNVARESVGRARGRWSERQSRDALPLKALG